VQTNLDGVLRWSTPSHAVVLVLRAAAKLACRVPAVASPPCHGGSGESAERMRPG
jgi:hypothetical protein